MDSRPFPPRAGVPALEREHARAGDREVSDGDGKVKWGPHGSLLWQRQASAGGRHKKGPQFGVAPMPPLP
jgi:hypothetical protein